MSKHHQILIIGGGTAGIMVAAQLLKKKQKPKHWFNRTSRHSLLSAGLDLGWSWNVRL